MVIFSLCLTKTFCLIFNLVCAIDICFVFLTNTCFCFGVIFVTGFNKALPFTIETPVLCTIRFFALEDNFGITFLPFCVEADATPTTSDIALLNNLCCPTENDFKDLPDVPFINPINSKIFFFFEKVLPTIKLKSFFVNIFDIETKSFLVNPLALTFFNLPVLVRIVLNSFFPGACATLPIPT